MPNILWQALQRDSVATCVALSDGAGRSLTYAQLWQAVLQRAELWLTLECRVLAVQRDNGIDWIIDDLAALKAGVACVPIPGFFSPAQREYVLAAAGVDCISGGVQAGFSPVAEGVWQRNVEAVTLPETCAKVTFTSGSTGTPKGVCLSAAQQIAVAQALLEVTQDSGIERHLCVLPLPTLLENIAGVYTPLLAGARIIAPSLADIGLRGASELNISGFITCLNETQPQSLIVLPQLLKVMVLAAQQGVLQLASLRFIAVGGAHIDPHWLRQASALGWPVVEGYGLSEAASVVCLNRPRQACLGTVGRPLPHVAVRLSDDGEVWVRGNTFLGYLGEEKRTPGQWLATGDLGQWQGDSLRLIGRKKNQFITAYGRNVNPEWVEAALLVHPSIKQAWVCGEAVPHNRALLVVSPEIDDKAIVSWVAQVNESLPDYARVHVWQRTQSFTAGNGLLTANGRLRRDALLSHFPLIDNSLAMFGDGVSA